MPVGPHKVILHYRDSTWYNSSLSVVLRNGAQGFELKTVGSCEHRNEP